jgi:SAM-dependent methyltransferase
MGCEVCVACGSSRFSFSPTISGMVCLVQCQECGIAYTHPRPEGNELEKNYSPSYYGPQNAKFVPVIEKWVAWMTTRRAHWIDKKIAPRSRILEIGCGRGLLLKALSHLGHECHGTERSDLAAAGAQRMVGIRIYTQPLEQCPFRENSFDAVILWHVLEHLENPNTILRHLFKLMKPEGLLIVEVPNLCSLQSRLAGKHWFHLDIERHLYHFTPAGLHRLLESSGFQGLTGSTFSLEQCPFGTVQSFLNSLGFPAEGLYKLLKNEISLPFSKRLLYFSLAGLTIFPASLFALAESLLGRGGVLTVTARKT